MWILEKVWLTEIAFGKLGKVPLRPDNMAFLHVDVEDLLHHAHEQALLTRLFSDAERQFIAQALAKHKLDDPSACRGLWLKIEANLMEADPDLNIEPLLDKMRKLSYAQELALIESL